MKSRITINHNDRILMVVDSIAKILEGVFGLDDVFINKVNEIIEIELTKNTDERDKTLEKLSDFLNKIKEIKGIEIKDYSLANAVIYTRIRYDVLGLMTEELNTIDKVYDVEVGDVDVDVKIIVKNEDALKKLLDFVKRELIKKI